MDESGDVQDVDTEPTHGSVDPLQGELVSPQRYNAISLSEFEIVLLTQSRPIWSGSGPDRVQRTLRPHLSVCLKRHQWGSSTNPGMATTRRYYTH